MEQDRQYNGKTLSGWFEEIKGIKALDHESVQFVDEKDWLNARLIAQTDLFHLAKDIFHLDLIDHWVCPNHATGEPHDTKPSEEEPCSVCGENLIPCAGIPPGQSIHRLICDFFVRKNPNKSVALQDTMKERLLLVPRGCFKSTIDEIDCVQWIICFPNIRLVLFTATEGLGVEFVSHVRSRFIVQADKDGNNKRYTHFQLLFPEHCIIPKVKEAEDRFTTPARYKVGVIGPSILALSLKQSTSGIHAEVGKFDDCVSNSNSGPGTSQDQRESVGAQIRLTRGVIELYGYRDNIGTPYDEKDAYAYKIVQTKPEDILTLIKPALEVKPESRNKKEEERVEFDYNFLFPIDAAGIPRLNYSALMRIKNDDLVVYCCQYLCRPSASRQVKFTEQLIRSCIVQEISLPQDPDVANYSVWDTAWSVESGSDYSVGAVISVVRAAGRGFIREIVRGRFSKQELPAKIADQGHRWSVQKIAIEGIPGAEASFDGPIKDHLERLGSPTIPVEFFPVDRSKNAKELRAEMVEDKLQARYLMFSSNIGIMDDVIHEFVTFKPHSKRKDDIVDAVAHACRYLPKAEPQQSPAVRAKILEDIMRDKMEHERLFPFNPNDDPNYHWSERPPIMEEPLPMDTFEVGGNKYPVFKNIEEQIYGK